jgi:hypothetical protein
MTVSQTRAPDGSVGSCGSTFFWTRTRMGPDPSHFFTNIWHFLSTKPNKWLIFQLFNSYSRKKVNIKLFLIIFPNIVLFKFEAKYKPGLEGPTTPYGSALFGMCLFVASHTLSLLQIASHSEIWFRIYVFIFCYIELLRRQIVLIYLIQLYYVLDDLIVKLNFHIQMKRYDYSIFVEKKIQRI